VATLINRLLPQGSTFLPKVQETESGADFLFRLGGASVPFAALSDGFRAYVGWVADMLYHLTLGAASGHRLDDTEGIVLIDEIDLHLHPQWQREVLPTLSKVLPKMQFIVSSHSALVTGSLRPSQVRVLSPDDAGTQVNELHESLQGRSVDQILRSPYFGLESTRSTGTQDRLRSLSAKVQGGDMQASLDYMRQMAGVNQAG
jgi:AAA domain, putative AbiEii toxin, Type IV TA system